jgi:hypothetical protein
LMTGDAEDCKPTGAIINFVRSRRKQPATLRLREQRR